MQNSTKIAEKSRFFLLKLIQQKIWKSLTKICEDFELRAVRRCGNLVDFEKRCKMRRWTQKSALIQLRTSLLKFDDLAENSERSSVSNFSTKGLTALRPRPGTSTCQRSAAASNLCFCFSTRSKDSHKKKEKKPILKVRHLTSTGPLRRSGRQALGINNVSCAWNSFSRLAD